MFQPLSASNTGTTTKPVYYNSFGISDLIYLYAKKMKFSEDYSILYIAGQISYNMALIRLEPATGLFYSYA